MLTSAQDGIFFESVCGVPVYRHERLHHEPGLVHGIFTRQGGVSLPPYSSLNVGSTVGDDPASVETNLRRMYRSLDIHLSQVVTCHQVHSADVNVVTSTNGGGIVGKADALVTDQPGVFLGMRFADCIPILLNDPERGVVGLVHAGWRGTLKQVSVATVQAMVQQFGCNVEDITAVIGPGIGPCCYQVGPDVVQEVESDLRDGDRFLSQHQGRYAHLDLWAINRQQLADAGLGNVFVMGLCTACNTNHFFSHRAERGRTGRFGVVIGYQD